MSATPNPDPSQLKLEATFHDEGASVVHTTYETNGNLSSQEAGAAVTTRWTDRRDLGKGRFGCVTLQETGKSHFRAVKRLFRGQGVDYGRELKVLSRVSDVGTPCGIYSGSG